MSVKSFYIKTYGCQMNIYDSQKMTDILVEDGYRPYGLGREVALDEEAYEQCDLIVINTCHIREKAEKKLFDELGKIRKIKNLRQLQGKNSFIIITGCVAQAEGDYIMQRAPFVDGVLGTQNIDKIATMLKDISLNKNRVSALDFPVIPKFDNLNSASSSNRVSAFLAIQEGCDKFCTFCVVPYTRGVEYSRPVEHIIREARVLIDRGAREITLLGQNVNAYHGMSAQNNSYTLANLIEHMAMELPELKRIRYTTSHPKDMSEDLMLAHKNITPLMPFLHLPVQSGSDKILQLMNRKHTRQFYLDTIGQLRSYVPHVALSSDFIVGFPGEEDEDFEQTMDLVDRVGFDFWFAFNYSPRPGTPAASREQIADQVKNTRLQILQSRLLNQQKNSALAQLHTVQEVLFEKYTRDTMSGLNDSMVQNLKLVGKNVFNHTVIWTLGENTNMREAQEFLGKIIKVKINRATAHTLYAEEMLEIVS